MQANEIIKSLDERANRLIVDYNDCYDFGTFENIHVAIKDLNYLKQELATLMSFIYAVMNDNNDLKTYYIDVVRIYNKVKKVVAKYDD